MADRARGASSTGAYRAGDKSGGGSGLKKLLFLLLGLLLLALLVFALISLIGGDDDESSSTSGAGQLTAGKTQLLPPPSGGLSPLTGEMVTGKNVVVQSVNGNEGFFVGSSTSDRVYIEWGGDVGEDEASKFQPKEGQKVNLTGPVQAATPKALRKLKLAAQDAELVRTQRGFVNADRVTAAG